MKKVFGPDRPGRGRAKAAGLFLSAFLLSLVLLPALRAPAEQVYGFIFPQSAQTYLTDADLQGLSAQLLCYARNEIFARNGRTFLSDELQTYFDGQFWYTPLYSPDQFSNDNLSQIEQANAQLLLDAEEALGTYTTDADGWSHQPVYDYLLGEQSAGEQTDPYYTDPDSYVFYGSDQMVLTKDEIGALSVQELCYARSEILARHGVLFYSMELQDFFDQKNWYWGQILPEDFPEDALNEWEKANYRALYEEETARNGSEYLTDQPGYTYSDVGSYAASGQPLVEESGYIFMDSNIRYLTREEIMRLSLQQINYARNEIYARRGCIFQSQELRDYFSTRSWYIPMIPAQQFSEDMFNEFEQANIRLLKECEYEADPNGYQLY